MMNLPKDIAQLECMKSKKRSLLLILKTVSIVKHAILKSLLKTSLGFVLRVAVDPNMAICK